MQTAAALAWSKEWPLCATYQACCMAMATDLKQILWYGLGTNLNWCHQSSRMKISISIKPYLENT